MNPIDNGSNDLPKAPMHRMSSDGGEKPKGGMSTVAIVGLVIGGLTLCCCLSCGGWLALNWTEFKKGFDEGFEKAQQQQKMKK